MAEHIADGRGNGYKLGVTIDGSGFVAAYADRLIQRIAYNDQGLPEYIGYAEPGTADGAQTWQIRKLTYVNMRVTAINFASGDANFDKEWDERTGYTYT